MQDGSETTEAAEAPEEQARKCHSCERSEADFPDDEMQLKRCHGCGQDYCVEMCQGEQVGFCCKCRPDVDLEELGDPDRRLKSTQIHVIKHTVEQKAELTDRYHELWKRLNDAADAYADAGAEYKAAKKEIKEESEHVNRIVAQGGEEGEVVVETRVYYREEVAVEVRTDTEEVILVRGLTKKERQLELPEGEDAPEEAPETAQKGQDEQEGQEPSEWDKVAEASAKAHGEKPPSKPVKPRRRRKGRK